MTYENPEEMAAVLGDVEDNSFIQQVQQDTEAFLTRLETATNRL